MLASDQHRPLTALKQGHYTNPDDCMKSIVRYHKTGKNKQINKKETNKQIKSKTTSTYNKTSTKQRRNNSNYQSDELQHRRLFTFACGSIIPPDTFFIAAAWCALRDAIHSFYSVAVRDALSLRSLRSLGSYQEVLAGL